MLECVENYKGLTVQNARMGEDCLIINFTNGSSIQISDEGQTCCEYRYMSTDDNPKDLIGGQFISAEIDRYNNFEDDWGENEQAFLRVASTKGAITVVTHNRHNGYYGGFCINIKNIS